MKTDTTVARSPAITQATASIRGSGLAVRQASRGGGQTGTSHRDIHSDHNHLCEWDTAATGLVTTDILAPSCLHVEHIWHE